MNNSNEIKLVSVVKSKKLPCCVACGYIVKGKFVQKFYGNYIDWRSRFSDVYTPPMNHLYFIEQVVKYINSYYSSCHACIYHLKDTYGEPYILGTWGSPPLLCAVNPLMYDREDCPDRTVE